MRRAIGRDFEAHRQPELALRQLAFERLAQVLDLFLVDPQVGVAGDAKLRIIDHLAAGEELVQMGVHDRRQQHERVVGPGDFRAARAITRGTRRGALTMATWVSRPKASWPESSTMKLRLLLTTCGNGCAGSRPIGVSNGLISRWK